ncbi:MAG: cupin domain-containing protein, partial [Halobaculum sp.]
MEHVAIDDVDAGAFGRDIDRRGLTEPLGTSDLAINHYRLDPGERLSGGMHAHMDQEEVFVVLDGEATFETPDGDVTVGANEAVRFAPGEFQSGTNESDSELRVLALGAPRDSEDVRVPRECSDCGHENMRAVPGDDGFKFVCPECGAEEQGRGGSDDVDTEENEQGSLGP